MHFTIRIILLLIIFLTSCERKDMKMDENDQDFPCGIINPIKKGDRQIGIDLLNTTEDDSFDNNLKLAAELGVDFITLHLNWVDLEPAPGQFVDPGFALEIIRQTIENEDLLISLTIRPIDATGKYVPQDLQKVRFSAPEMADRFTALSEYIFSKINPERFINYQVGNEIDNYNTSGESTSFWEDYEIFLENSRTKILKKFPGLKIGFTITFEGAVNNKARYQKMAEDLDQLGITYYPLNGDFSVKNAGVVTQDIDRLVSGYRGIPLAIQEAGYPTSTECKSNEEMQADFFCQFFKVWDDNQNRIQSASILRLNDLSQTQAETSAGPYGISYPPFLAFLRTLGIRTHPHMGENKMAFEVIRSNLSSRGW